MSGELVRSLGLAKNFVGQYWKKLEIEEQAHARQLMRGGYVQIEGTGTTRKLIWTDKGAAAYNAAYSDEEVDLRF